MMLGVLNAYSYPQWTSNLQCHPQLGPLRSPVNKIASEEKAFSACTTKSPAPPIVLRGCPTPSKLHPPTPHSLNTPSLKTTNSSMGSDPTMEQLVPERDTNPGTRLTVDMCNNTTVQETFVKTVIPSQENQSCNLKVQHRWVFVSLVSSSLGYPCEMCMSGFVKRWVWAVWKFSYSQWGLAVDPNR
jgi:hypothetical protein